MYQLSYCNLDLFQYSNGEGMNYQCLFCLKYFFYKALIDI